MKLFPGIAAVALLAGAASAQRLHLGQPAPEVALEEWIGVEPGEEPTLARLRGRVVMIEFWGTWCAPCVQSMRHVQELADRYAELGLAVLAISNEPRALVEPFAEKNGYTLAFGCDPEMQVVGSYRVASWPSTYLIDERGRIAYIGTPGEVEPAIERALGLPADAAGALLAYARAALRGEEELERSTLRLLIDRRPRAFDLARWARVAPGGPPAEDVQPEGSPGELLDGYIAALGKGGEEVVRRALGALAASDAPAFDLLGWARERFRAAWPIEREELAALLEKRRHADVVEALLQRGASAELATLAAADEELQAWCARQAPDARSRAKKGLMVERWIFAGIEPRNSQRFWSDLGVAGLQRAGDDSAVQEVRLGSEALTPASVASYVDEELELSIALSSLASGRAPATRATGLSLDGQRERLLESLRARYGG